MERLFNIAVIHFIATAISVLGYGAIGPDNVLGQVLMTLMRFLTVPARQISNMIVAEPGMLVWLFYAANSLFWAALLTLALTLANRSKSDQSSS